MKYIISGGKFQNKGAESMKQNNVNRVEKKMRVGIVTYHTSYNYGAFLQAYALCKRISKIDGVNAEIIDFSMKKAEKMNILNAISDKRSLNITLWNLLRYQMFRKSINNILPLSYNSIRSDKLNDFNQFVSGKYDLIVAGSDEIWKVDGYRGFPSPYWLPYENVQYKKASYGASSRTKAESISLENIRKINSYLDDYLYIGVRDNSTFSMLDTICKKDTVINKNCDPTFLWDFEENKDNGKRLLKKKYHCNSQKKTIALMSESDELAELVLKKFGESYNIIPLYQKHKGMKGFFVPNPFEWIDIISACDGLITTYFHGTVFAIKTGTPFVSVETRKIDDPTDSKIFDLLFRNDMADRFGLMCDKNFDAESHIEKLFIESDDVFLKKCSDLCRLEIKYGDSFLDMIREEKSKCQ